MTVIIRNYTVSIGYRMQDKNTDKHVYASRLLYEANTTFERI